MGAAVRDADIALIMAALEPTKTVEQRILSVVSKRPIPRVEIAEAAGCSNGSLSLCLRNLMRAGKIKQSVLSYSVGQYRRGTKFYLVED